MGVLEIEQVRKLDYESPIDKFAPVGVARVVVYDIEVAQRAVCPIEPDVRADAVRFSVVLDKGVEECKRVEAVDEPGSHKVGREAPIWKGDAVPNVIEVESPSIVGFQAEGTRKRRTVPIPEIAPIDTAVTTDRSARITRGADGVFTETVIPTGDRGSRPNRI